MTITPLKKTKNLLKNAFKTESVRMIDNCFLSQLLFDGLAFEIKSIKNADPFIWQEAFGDSLSEIAHAMEKLKNCGFCASLSDKNEVLSQFIGLETNFKNKKGIYIYALCTNPSYRNKGYMRRLLELSFEYGKKVGYDFFWLFPASEELKNAYNKLGFTIEIPVGASPFPTAKNDFYNLLDFDICNSGLAFSLFDGNYKRLYSFFDNFFDYDTFEYSLAVIKNLIDIKYIVSDEKITGCIIFSKSFPKKALCVSNGYSHIIKTVQKGFAYLYPLSSSDYKDLSPVEPLPR